MEVSHVQNSVKRSINISDTVMTSLFGIGFAYSSFENISTAVKRYVFPRPVSGNTSYKSISHTENALEV